MEILLGLGALILVLFLGAGQVNRDAKELGCGCTASLLLIFAVVLIGTLAVFTGGTFMPK